MTTTAALSGREVQVPCERGGTLVCPRCAARLLHDGANVICVLCGYEYGVAQLIAHRHRHDDAATTAQR